MNSSKFLIASLVMATFASSVFARGGTLIDNFDQPFDAVTVLGTDDPDRLWTAQGFSSPRAYRLMSIELMLGQTVDSPDPVAELRVGSPDGPVVSILTIPALQDGPVQIETLLPQSEVILAPGETYWIVIGPATQGSIGMAYALGNDYSGFGSFGEYAYSTDVGATWSAFGTDNPYFVRISGLTCTADFNGDGVVDFFDYLDFVDAFSAQSDSADFNHDAVIDFFDYLDFVDAFSTGC